MNIFLIQYNRAEGRLVTFRTFDDSQRREAEKARHDLELDLHRKGIEHEIVLLEAESESALRKSYRRYFESLDEILKSEIRRAE